LTIYLDNMAATPIYPRVAEAHRDAMLRYHGNAHSVEHAVGVEAQEAIDESAAAIIGMLGTSADALTFTPGASSALWLAVEDAIARIPDRPARIAATAVEHPALLSALRTAERAGRISLTIIQVDATAAPELDVIADAMAGGIDLLCTMAANNETGTITALAAISVAAGRHGTRHLVDASQAIGRLDPGPIASADIVVLSGAKIYGPRRVGAMIGRLTPHAQQLAHDVFGSPDTPGAVALAQAVALRESERVADEARIAAMRDTLQARLIDAVPGLVVNGSPSRLAGSLHLSSPHVPGEAAVARLWGQVAVSTGAACQSGVPGPSHVMTAMGVPEWIADGAVRIGVGKFNTPQDIDRAADMIGTALNAAPLRKTA
jgi:cysteine desulfurase